jgi:hypothetical protein
MYSKSYQLDGNLASQALYFRFPPKHEAEVEPGLRGWLDACL